MKSENKEMKFYAAYGSMIRINFWEEFHWRTLLSPMPAKLFRRLLKKRKLSVETYLDDTEVADIMREVWPGICSSCKRAGTAGGPHHDRWRGGCDHRAGRRRPSVDVGYLPKTWKEDDSVWKNTRTLTVASIGIVGGLLNAKFMGLLKTKLCRLSQ